MATKWLVGFAMLFLIATIMSQIIEYGYADEETATTLWSAMTSFEAVSFSNPITAVWNIMIGIWDIIKALFNMFVWNYSFFTGELIIFRYFLWSISLGVVISLLLAIRGTSSG